MGMLAALLLLQASALEPSGDPGNWALDNDYPVEARRAGHEGVVVFRLTVDAAGAVSRCEVTTSSGSPVLDATTCQLMRERARFKPARDERGRAIAATYSNRVTWRIPKVEAIPLTSFQFVGSVTITSAGSRDCKIETRGKPRVTGGITCEVLTAMGKQAIREPGDTARFTLVNALVREGDPDFPDVPVSSDTTSARGIAMAEIGADGALRGCEWIERAAAMEGLKCEPMFTGDAPFGPFQPDPQGASHRVRATFQVMLRLLP